MFCVDSVMVLSSRTRSLLSFVVLFAITPSQVRKFRTFSRGILACKIFYFFINLGRKTKEGIYVGDTETACFPVLLVGAGMKVNGGFFPSD